MPHCSHSLRARVSVGALLISTGLLSTPTVAFAQKGGERNFTLAYEPGSPSKNGYADAQLRLTYWFAACPGVHLVVRMSENVNMLVGNHRYWFDGKLREVPPTISAPRPEKPVVKGTVRGPNVAQELTHYYASTSPSCGFNGTAVAEAGGVKPWKAGATDAEKVQILNQFGFDYQQTLGTLRNTEVENYFREQVAAARQDSIKNAQVARTDSINRARVAAARQDSIARARSTATSPRPTGSASSAPAPASGASASAAPAAPAAPASASMNRYSQNAQPARDTARENAAQRQLQAQQYAAALQQQAEAQAAADKAREEALVSATSNFVGSIMAARAADQAAREAREERQRLALEQYQAKVAAAFAAMPPQPKCTPNDVIGDIQLGGRAPSSVDGSECRTDAQNSAESYRLRLTKRERVEAFASAAFYANIVITDLAGNVVAKGAPSLKTDLFPGDYRVTVSTSYPGETGSYTLGVDVGTYSNADGPHVAFYFDGGVASADGAPDFSGNFAGLRLSLGPKSWFNIIGETYGSLNDDSFLSLEFGARSYLLNRHSKLRPFAQYTWGYREINQVTMSLDGYAGEGHGYTWGFGAEWFTSPRFSLEGGLFHSNGDLEGLPFSSTRLRLGFSAHRSLCGWTCD